jgi:hypothetical protein
VKTEKWRVLGEKWRREEYAAKEILSREREREEEATGEVTNVRPISARKQDKDFALLS